MVMGNGINHIIFMMILFNHETFNEIKHAATSRLVSCIRCILTRKNRHFLIKTIELLTIESRKICGNRKFSARTTLNPLQSAERNGRLTKKKKQNCMVIT